MRPWPQKAPFMKPPVPAVRFLMVSMVALALGACSSDHDDKPAPPPLPPAPAARIQVELARTTHGVPHVRADDFRSLGYGLAYAYAQDNVCMFADSLLDRKSVV